MLLAQFNICRATVILFIHNVDDGFIECVIDCAVWVDQEFNKNYKIKIKFCNVIFFFFFFFFFFISLTPLFVFIGIAIAPKTVPSKTWMKGTLLRFPSLLRWRSFDVESVSLLLLLLALLPFLVAPGGGRWTRWITLPFTSKKWYQINNNKKTKTIVQALNKNHQIMLIPQWLKWLTVII